MNKGCNRIVWIDNWKGLMLLVVCLGHYYVPIPGLWLLSTLHVASFFFLSGVLFKFDNVFSFKSFFRRKCHSLLIPYFTLSLFFFFLDPCLYDYHRLIFEPEHKALMSFLSPSFFQYDSSWKLAVIHLLSIFVEGKSSEITASMWFVFSLFSIELVVYVLNKISRKLNSISTFFLLLSALGCCLTGWTLWINNIFLLWHIEVTLTAGAITLFGFLSKPLIERLINRRSIELFFFAAISAVLYIYGLNINGVINLHGNYLCHNLWGYIITIVFGLYLYLLLMIILNRVKDNFKVGFFLRYISVNSMCILAVHYWAGKMCRYMLPRLQDEYFFPYIQLLIGITACCFFIPIFNNYLPWMVGKTNKICK